MTTWLVAIALFVGTVALFSRSLGYGFTNYDDPDFVVNNPHVHAGFTAESIRWAFSGGADYWHPLTWLSHMLDWQLFGANARGHHLTSILWHALNAVLAFIVMRRLTGAFWTSAIGAALFAWHPLRVESVTWVTERKDVMSGCFFLLTLWAYTAYAARRSTGRYVLVLLAFAGGLMCKPMLVTLPLLLLVLDVWPLRRLATISWRALLIEKIPFFVLSLATAAATIWLQHRNDAFTLSLPLDARLGNAVVSVARYLGKFFWPFDLSVCYPHPGYWPVWVVTSAIVLSLALTLGAWTQRQARPWLLVGWLWFLAMLLPASGVVQAGFQAMADRYTYIPGLGLQLALLWTLRDWPVAIRGGLAALALIGCAWRTWDQQSVWRDPEALFRHALAVDERNNIAHGFLGYTLAALGRDEEAQTHCLRAMEINPDSETAAFALAKLRARYGRVDEAIALFRRVLEINPRSTESKFLLGQLLLQKEGAFPEAIGYLKAAVERDPQYRETNLQLAMLEVHEGRNESALRLYGAAVELDPRNAALRVAYAELLARQRQFGAALAQYDAAVQLTPDDANAHAGRGYMLILVGRRSDAVAAWTEALRLNPDIPGLRARLEKLRAENPSR